jgi:hypothetical protein
MTLREWMEKLDVNIDEAAKSFGVSIYAVKKWLSGERIPRPTHQRKVKKITRGDVTPTDWIK